VRNIREDFVFHDVGTLEGRGFFKGYGKLITEAKKAAGYMKTGHMASKPTKLDASNKYIRLVKQALVPGGHFIVTAGDQNADRVATKLRENGFIVTTRKLTRDQVQKSGSGQAIFDVSQGHSVYRILATKPKNKNAPQRKE
ncbi:MAG: hypothetical protein Q7R47_03030, partial [Candidatus Diapherotrites archaeon]|nr:hypothetical protein [Candidatus Diapherotrites archaeon]